MLSELSQVNYLTWVAGIRLEYPALNIDKKVWAKLKILWIVKEVYLPFTDNAVMTTDRKDSSQVPWVLWYLQPKQANNEIISAAEQTYGFAQVLVTTHSKAAFQEGALRWWLQ